MINNYPVLFTNICLLPIHYQQKNICNYYLKLRYLFPAERRNSENKKELLINDVIYEIEVWHVHQSCCILFFQF